MTTLKTRCRQIGVDHDDKGIREARAPWYGCNAGRAMASASPQDDRQDLWAAICHMRAVAVRYSAAIGAPSRYAKCLAILAPSEAMEVTADSPPLDMRSDVERQRSATSAWMAMHGWLGYVDKPAASQALRAVIDDPDLPVTDTAGLVLALRCISDGIKGASLIYRGRDSRRG